MTDASKHMASAIITPSGLFIVNVFSPLDGFCMDVVERTQSPTPTLEWIKGRFKAIGPLPRFEGSNLIVVRQAETISDVFPDWIDRSELDTPFYVPFDLNMPVSIPRRQPMRESYKIDPPLSEIGKITSQLLAREIATRRATPITAVYSAPTLACLQTAHEMTTFLGHRCGSIRINPDLSPQRPGMEYWLSKEQLSRLGYKLDNEYHPLVSMNPCTSVQSVINCMESFLSEISTEGNAIVVADPLATKAINDSVRGISQMQMLKLEDAYDMAEKEFPPCSTAVFQCEIKHEEVSLKSSSLFLRPLTAIDISTAKNFV